MTANLQPKWIPILVGSWLVVVLWLFGFGMKPGEVPKQRSERRD